VLYPMKIAVAADRPAFSLDERAAAQLRQFVDPRFAPAAQNFTREEQTTRA
jgi:hypothetical protein